MQYTLKAKIKDQSFNPILGEMAEEISSARRSLFVQLGVLKRKVPELKKEFIREKKITARQFNSIRYEVQGLIQSQRELKSELVQKTKRKKKAYLEKLEVAERKNQLLKVHQYKRKILILDQKIEKYSKTKTCPNVCFGGKDLFKQQNHLKENGFKDFSEWKQAWREARDSTFFLIGSHEESFGNQSCQLLPGKLRLRLTHSLAQKYGQDRLDIPVEFTYGENILFGALALKQAMNYRFIREKNGFWYVHLTTEYEKHDFESDFKRGGLGIDLNPSCIAVTEINSEGNLLLSWQIPVDLKGKRSEQAVAILGDRIAEIVEYAKKQKIPIVVEKLDFENKKQELRSRGMNRMLSSFAYSLFYQMIFSRSYREGVRVKEINPAYTSIIGKYKFSSGYGLSTHMSASLAIARRGLGFGERLCAKTKQRLPLPARTRGKHVWSDWRRLNQEAKKKKMISSSSWQQPDCAQGDGKSSWLTPKSLAGTLKDFETKATTIH